MEFTQDIKDSIKNNMLHITTSMKNKPRNYLNKQLQDAVCNYFLENYAAPYLKEEYQLVSGRELRKKIEKSLPSQGKKYINLLNKFKSEIQRVNKGEEYRTMLSSIVSEEEKYEFESEEWCTLQRKKILALLLIVHWDEENILNFYDMWNSLYPCDPLIKQKLSKEEKEKQKKQAKNQTNIQAFKSENANRFSYSSTDSCSFESNLSINSKRTSSSLIPKQNQAQVVLQAQPVYIQQQPQYNVQPIQKKIINNRIFEDEEEQQEVQTKLRVCEIAEIPIQKQMFYQQQKTIFANFYQQSFFNKNNSVSQMNQQQSSSFSNYQQNTQDISSSHSLGNCETSSSINENASSDNCSLENEACSDFTSDEIFAQQDYTDIFNNAIFFPNFAPFMNDNSQFNENTPYPFMNF